MQNKVDLVFEDWKKAHEKIEHFSDILLRLRLEGISIASAIIGAGLATFEYTSKIVFNTDQITINGTSIVILLGAVYLLPIFALDMFYFKLLLISVKHARQIEEEKYGVDLRITRKLTSKALTIAHTVIAIIIYVGIFITALALAYAVNYLPNT